eukprot:TRINITY_DN10040_c0_g1_i3.p1 TRINITY_DN10040_c0_g1~~TRINITY_DN10040_c0_g1_i3.p1  ORF type:complete len:248 (-),score=43.33 TRINITY_DN10040_c0_g1_i3:115-858(-)
MAMLAFSYHAIVLSLDIYVLVWVLQNLGWQVIAPMLTMWGHVFHTVYFLWVFVQDIRMALDKADPTTYGRTAEKLFTMTFVLATIVGILFWGIYAVDRDLVLPPDVEKYYPGYINMYQHGYVAVLIWIELYVRRVENLSLHSDITTSFGLAGLYVVWNAYLGYTGNFPYPFQKILPLWGHVIFDAGAFGVLYCLIMFKRFCVLRFHGSGEVPPSTASKARKLLNGGTGRSIPSAVPRSAPPKAKKIL